MHSKCKMVSFRLSVAEYTVMLELCRSHGYRNMSRFALYAMRSFVPVAAASDGPVSETSDLRRQIDKLAAELGLLAESVQWLLQSQCTSCGASIKPTQAVAKRGTSA
jgi:hypothetical protein